MTNPVTDELQAAFNEPGGLSTTQYLDIWQGAEFSDLIDTFVDWSGDNDAAAQPTWTLTLVGYGRNKYWAYVPIATDVNVTFTDNEGAIQLTSGAAVTAPTPSTYTAVAEHSYDASLQRYLLGTSLYLVGIRSTVTLANDAKYRTNDEVTHIPFTPVDDLIMDSFTLRITKAFDSDNVSFPMLTIFPEAGDFQVSIVDVSGQVIGNTILKDQVAGTTTHSIVGLNAACRRGVQYYLQMRSFSPTVQQMSDVVSGDFLEHNPFITTTFFAHDLTGVAGWQIENDPLIGFDMGGTGGYQATGSFLRSLDLGASPTEDGLFLMTDLTPSDSTIVVNLYHTTDPLKFALGGLVGWTAFAGNPVSDGDALTVPVGNDRYWRASVDLTSSTGQGETPAVERLELAFSQKPIVYGTYNEIVDDGTGNETQGSIQALDSVTSTGASMNPILSSTIDGQTRCIILPETGTEDLIDLPRGRRCRYRRGFLDPNGIRTITETITVNEGALLDVQWDGQKYTLTFQDDIGIDDEAKMPKDKADVYVAGTDYAVDAFVAYNRKKYKSLVTPNIGNTPDVSPGFWQDEGTVWIDVFYAANTHLVDIVIDVLTNQLNIDSRRIDFKSLEQIRALYPNRKIISNKLIDSPTSIKEALEELSWLLESSWVKSNGKIALIAEPPVDLSPSFTIIDDDIETINYRRGKKNLKNTCIIQTDYEDGIAYDGVVNIDTASVTTNDNRFYIYSFVDKWNVDPVELGDRASSYTDRNAAGRRIIEMTGALRLENLEIGEAVQFNAPDYLPPGDPSIINMFVVANNRDNSQIKTKLTLMEI